MKAIVLLILFSAGLCVGQQPQLDSSYECRVSYISPDTHLLVQGPWQDCETAYQLRHIDKLALHRKGTVEQRLKYPEHIEYDKNFGPDGSVYVNQLPPPNPVTDCEEWEHKVVPLDTCASSQSCFTPYCAPNLHTVTEKEWQELTRKVNKLELLTVTKYIVAEPIRFKDKAEADAWLKAMCSGPHGSFILDDGVIRRCSSVYPSPKKKN